MSTDAKPTIEEIRAWTAEQNRLKVEEFEAMTPDETFKAMGCAFRYLIRRKRWSEEDLQEVFPLISVPLAVETVQEETMSAPQKRVYASTIGEVEAYRELEQARKATSAWMDRAVAGSMGTG